MQTLGYTSPLLTDPNALLGNNALTVADPSSGLSYDFSTALDGIAPGLAATTAQASASTGQSWIQTLSNLASSLVMANSQRQLLNVQLQRAQQGLPPLDASQVGLGVSVGVSPSTQKMLWIGGAVVAVLLFMALSSRKPSK